MRAQVLQRPNDPFTLTELPLPTLSAGQVLVRIKASGVNPLDTKIRAGGARMDSTPEGLAVKSP